MVFIIRVGVGGWEEITKGHLNKDSVAQEEEGPDLLLFADPVPSPDHLLFLLSLGDQLLLSHQTFSDRPPSEQKPPSSVLQAWHPCPCPGPTSFPFSVKAAHMSISQ